VRFAFKSKGPVGWTWGAGLLCAAVVVGTAVTAADATLVDIINVSGANSAQITTTPPNPVQPNPNNGILLAWDERQNVTLQSDLAVDRVFDTSASFVSSDGSGGYLIHAGTVVSSHYLQWDPGNGSSSDVSATVQLDSQVFAFITADQKLFDSDGALGLPGLDYNNFGLRGLEGADTTNFNGPDVDIDWGASNPGDWTRLLTAFSPSAAPELTSNNDPTNPATVDFGAVRVGTTGTASLTLINDGGEDPNGLQGYVPTPAAGEFALDDPNSFGPISSNASDTRQYSYTPTTRGADSLAIGPVSSNDPNGINDGDAPVTLSGTGVGPVASFADDGNSVSSGDTLDFGVIDTDQTAPLTLDLTNSSGDAGPAAALTDLTINSFAITGADADKFSISLPDGSVANRLQTIGIEILFDPNGMEGLFDDATLTLFTDEGAALGGDGSDFTFNLVGQSVPEPTSIALLGLGSLALARRRRR